MTLGRTASLRCFAIAGLLLAGLALSGCGSAGTSDGGADYYRLTRIAPPPNPVEIPVTPAEPSKEVWRPGYWEYGLGGFHWVEGRLMPRPTLSAVWSPDHWEMRGYGWAFVHGYWQ